MLFGMWPIVNHAVFYVYNVYVFFYKCTNIEYIKRKWNDRTI